MSEELVKSKKLLEFVSIFGDVLDIEIQQHEGTNVMQVGGNLDENELKTVFKLIEKGGVSGLIVIKN